LVGLLDEKVWGEKSDCGDRPESFVPVIVTLISKGRGSLA
jgi:hypothetical protein